MVQSTSKIADAFQSPRKLVGVWYLVTRLASTSGGSVTTGTACSALGVPAEETVMVGGGIFASPRYCN